MRDLSGKMALVALAGAALGLASCTLSQLPQIPPDVGATDPDRFVEETTPVWARSEPVRKRPAWFDVPLFGARAAVRPGTIPIHAAETDAGFPAKTAYAPDPQVTGSLANPWAIYDPVDDGGHWLPAIPVDKVPERFLRRQVLWTGAEPAGTIVVDTRARHLFLVLGEGRAIRYGIGIGQAGRGFRGEGVIARTASWPKWTPTEAMVEEQPNLMPFSVKHDGLVGGLNNPLGARALYISQGGQDTLYRVHGTPDWKSIGHEVSSGCVRMFNQDVIDLASRVPQGARIIVR